MSVTKSLGRLAENYLFNPVNKYLDGPISPKLSEYMRRDLTTEVNGGIFF
ncbi:MAG: hypothetical protein AABX28_03565 [Nanoarchaeota archaeon]